jgi:hypothetical protein
MPLWLWKCGYWLKNKFPSLLLGMPRKILRYQLNKTTYFEKLIFIVSYFLGAGIASDGATNFIEFVISFWLIGTFTGWFLFGFWRWFLRNFTRWGY